MPSLLFMMVMVVNSNDVVHLYEIHAEAWRWLRCDVCGQSRPQKTHNRRSISSETIRWCSEESIPRNRWRLACRSVLTADWYITSECKSFIDPAHTKDKSGCTAVAALVTDDGKIYVVCEDLFCLVNAKLESLAGKCGRFKISDECQGQGETA